MNKLLITLMLLMFAGSLVAQKIYKWVDEEGQSHYSSQKPVGQEVERVTVRKGPKVTAPEVKPKADVEATKAALESKEDAAAKAQLAKSDKVNRKKMCEQARKNMAALNATVRVNTIDEKTGETVRMNDNQRVEAMKNAQKGIKEYCQ